ncbi:hypothetical protein [Anaerovorax odorimutans]|uniref:hypothetical protein n=1 Tax=Anaerovorax odorimutans TaxID=109327 RepID=UPI0003FE99BD|nr:hypothetical protein [Anaerovorax odorimutans]
MIKAKNFLMIFFIIGILLTSGCSSNAVDKENKTDSKKEKNTIIIEGDNVLFQGECSAYTILDSTSIIEGKEASIICDIDNDGEDETFIIGRNHPNGISVSGMKGNYGINFAYDFEIDEAFDQYGLGEVKEGYYIQITCCDLDGDEVDEVIVSLGDLCINLETLVYRVSLEEETPFILVGRINGQQNIKFDKQEHSINVPYGSQGLFTEYKLIDKKLYVRADTL